MSFFEGTGLGPAEATTAAHYLNQPAEKYVNNTDLELQWAMKAFNHAEVYFNLLLAVDPKLLKLTQIDDKIYAEMRKTFPDLDVSVLDVDAIKSEAGKEEWREFCNKFEKQVEDWNMATLVRVSAADNVSEENSIVVPRIQFLAIEIARNREGVNDGKKLKEEYGPKRPAASGDS